MHMELKNLPTEWSLLSTWIEGLRLNPYGKATKYLEKYDRLMAYRSRGWDCASRLDKAWSVIIANQRSQDDAISVFIHLPSEVTTQPYTALFGERVLDPVSEKKRYLELASQVEATLQIINYQNIDLLLRDLDTKNTRIIDYFETRSITAQDFANEALSRWQEKGVGKFDIGTTRQTLLWFIAAFKGADPSHKYLTKKPLAKDAALQTYTAQLATINNHLSSPKHSAIAVLASANMAMLGNQVAASVTAQAIKDAWNAHATTIPLAGGLTIKKIL